jgi:hypothetical protein
MQGRADAGAEHSLNLPELLARRRVVVLSWCRGSEEQVAKLRKCLEEIFRNVSLAHDVVAICIELGEGNSGACNPEIAHVLRRCVADKLHFQLEVLTKVIERLGGAFQQCRGGKRREGYRMSASNYQRSRQVLQGLVQGADPEIGRSPRQRSCGACILQGVRGRKTQPLGVLVGRVGASSFMVQPELG